MNDIIDKIFSKLNPELIEIIHKYIYLDNNLNIIRRQKELKKILHNDLDMYFYKKYIEIIQQYFYIEYYDNYLIISIF